jgi:hypothetical protein
MSAPATRVARMPVTAATPKSAKRKLPPPSLRKKCVRAFWRIVKAVLVFNLDASTYQVTVSHIVVTSEVFALITLEVVALITRSKLLHLSHAQYVCARIAKRKSRLASLQL